MIGHIMIETSGTVVFMGAGASRAFGLPLTDQILPKIVRRLRSTTQAEPRLFPGRKTNDLVEHLRQTFLALYPGLDLLLAPDAQLPNITSVLSFLDHLILYDQPAALRFGKQQLVHGRRLLERAMMEILVDTDLSPITERLGDAQDYTSEMLEIPGMTQRAMSDDQRALLDGFLSWMFKRTAATGGRLNIITTNYDVAVETPIYKRFGPEHLPKTVDFGFDWRNPLTEALVPGPEQPSLGLYKLHGSFNWLRCDLCGQLYVNPLEVIAYLSFNEEQAWAIRVLVALGRFAI